jgi:putative FmdB family regulatory protein
MPRYDYLCPQNHRFEAVHPMKQAGKGRKCPECGKKAEITFSAVGINGGQLSDKQRWSYRGVFKDSTIEQIKTVRDVDSAMDRIQKKYEHFGRGFGKEIL